MMRATPSDAVGDGRLLVMPNAARSTGTWVIGQPGSGKSKLLELLALQDVLAGRGVAVIDPHGDLFHNLTLHLATISRRPELASRMVIVDPTDPKWTVGINPLAAIQGISQARMALFLADVVQKVWGVDATHAPRMVWLITHTFAALADLGLSLLDLPRFLLDPAFREPLLPALSQENVRAFFAWEFPRSPSAVHQWTVPILNKLDLLLFDPDLQLMFVGQPTFNARAILDRQLILLVNLPKGILGESTSALLAAFIVAHLQKAALARADSPEHRPSYTLVLDEFQSYSAENIPAILSESRKYNLTITVAHQYLGQLSSGVRTALPNTAGTIICFRVGYPDAREVAREVFPSPDFLVMRSREIRLERLGPLPLPIPETREEPLGWENLALQLSNLPPRVFWLRRRGSHVPVRQRTLDLPDPILTTERQAQLAVLVDAAGQRFGRLKTQARQAASATGLWSPQSAPQRGAAADHGDDDDALFWEPKPGGAG